MRMRCKDHVTLRAAVQCSSKVTVYRTRRLSPWAMNELVEPSFWRSYWRLYWLDSTTGLFVATVRVSILNNCTRRPFYRFYYTVRICPCRGVDIKHGWHLSLSLSLCLVSNMCAWRSLSFSPSCWSVMFRVSQTPRVVRNPLTLSSAMATRAARAGWPHEECGPLSRQWIR